VTVRPDSEALPGCPCSDEPCRHIRTLEGDTPYQDDYIYASPDLADAMRLVTFERTTGVEAVRDHLPLAAELH
jgi:endonuclease/exonuclease/phosphatase family metal-dependent hydrolase